MNFFKTAVGAVAASMLFAACGVPLEGEELGEQEAVGTSEQAVTNVNNCAIGETPNATGSLGNSDGYTRSSAYSNPGVCGVAPRETAIVDFYGVANTKYRFNTSVNFGGSAATDLFKCLQSKIAMRTLKKVGSSWVEIDYRETVPTFNSSGCFGGNVYIVPSSQYSPSGDYRVRGKAIKWNGDIETISIYGAYWN